MPDDNRFEISTDPDRLDRDRIHRWLSEDAYWALSRTRAVQDAAIDVSRNYAVYEAGELVGYARVVTDGVTFAWLCDVFVDSSVRGHGVASMLLDALTADLDRAAVRRTILATADAHDLYARYGFAPLDDPSWWMTRS